MTLQACLHSSCCLCFVQVVSKAPNRMRVLLPAALLRGAANSYLLDPTDATAATLIHMAVYVTDHVKAQQGLPHYQQLKDHTAACLRSVLVGALLEAHDRRAADQQQHREPTAAELALQDKSEQVGIHGEAAPELPPLGREQVCDAMQECLDNVLRGRVEG